MKHDIARPIRHGREHNKWGNSRQLRELFTLHRWEVKVLSVALSLVAFHATAVGFISAYLGGATNFSEKPSFS